MAPPRRSPLRSVAPSAQAAAETAQGHALHLNAGDSLHVERKRESAFDFVGDRGFYMMSVELAGRLPHMGLTATDYDVLMHLIHKLKPGRGRTGALDGCTLKLSQKQIGAELGISRQDTGVSLRFLANWSILWLGRGKVTINPRCVFIGRSQDQARAIAEIPSDIPEVELPDTTVRPPRRRRTLKGEGR